MNTVGSESSAEVSDAKTGQPVIARAQIIEVEAGARYMIRYSHTCLPSIHAVNHVKSDTFTQAGSIVAAQAIVRGFFATLDDAYEITVWNDDLVAA